MALTDEAVAVTTLVPPRRKTAQIEALYNNEPDKAALNELRVKLAVLAALNEKGSPSPAKTKSSRSKDRFLLPLPLSGERGFKKTPSIAPQVRVEQVGNLDWLKKVAADFPPLAIGRWTVYGGEHRHAVEGRRLRLRIDATNAFGTGEHPTTRGCLLMLDRVLKTALANALDVGCGSGILAMAFAKACRGSAVAVDLDPDSVAIARGNVRATVCRPLFRLALVLVMPRPW